MSERLERLKSSLADSYVLESEIGRDGQFDDLDDPPERMLHD